MNRLDARIIDLLQTGLAITERPFEDPAARLGLDEQALIDRLAALLDEGVLSRFGPLFNADIWGGGYLLCAMSVPEAEFERVTELVNGHPEVAHNYRRDHALNMWFVIATERRDGLSEVVEAIATETGLTVLDLPKEQEYFVGLQLDAERV